MVEKLLGNLRVLPNRILGHVLAFAVLLRQQVDTKRLSVRFGDFPHVTVRPKVSDHVILGRVELDDRARLQVRAALDVFIHERGQPGRATLIDQANRSQLVIDIVVGFIEPLKCLVFGGLGQLQAGQQILDNALDTVGFLA
nr:hypothetical protein [Crateriforma conspicua]